MTNSFVRVSTTLSAAVDEDGTIDFALPSGYTAANFESTGAKLWLQGLQSLLDQGASTFTVAYDSDITVTYEAETTIPAGTYVELQIPIYAETAIPGVEPYDAIADMGGSSTTANHRTAINSILAVLRSAGLLDAA